MAAEAERRKGPVRGMAVVAAGLIMALLGLCLVLYDMRTLGSYGEIATEFTNNETTSDLGSRVVSGSIAGSRIADKVDWSGLRAVNGDVVAWVELYSALINLPVCQGADDAPSWYLDHDIWGEWSSVGCAYLDHRSSSSCRNALVYGHHIYNGGMFSELFRTFEQGEFERVVQDSELVWYSYQGEPVVLKPLCAVSVDQSYEAIQQFSFEDDAEYREWLAGLLRGSDVEAPGAEEMVADATRSVTLVTCSSLWGGQRERTLVTYVA